jgi:type II secretory pathway pseudopilin PulG
MKQKLPKHIGGESIMKTNADLSHPELINNCERECAFTLTELLVVMATLAILAAVMLPALAKSGDNGMRTVCLNNLRQMGTALNMYAGENQDTMPWPNWGNNGPPCPAGWLYSPNPNTPNNLEIVTPGAWATLRDDNLKTGTFWQYLNKADLYFCPAFLANVVGTKGPLPIPNWENYENKLSSYCMNGASCFFPPLGISSIYGYRSCKVSQIWSPSCIILWEPSGTSGSGYGYNDGANYPSTDEGVSCLHVTVANVLTVSGNARVMSFTDFLAEMNNPPANVHNKGKGLLWWNPNSNNGH